MDTNLWNSLITAVPVLGIVGSMVFGIIALHQMNAAASGDFKILEFLNLSIATLGISLSLFFLFEMGPSLYQPTSSYRAQVRSVTSVEMLGGLLSEVRLGNTVVRIRAGPERVKVGEQGLIKRFKGHRLPEACFQVQCFEIVPETFFSSLKR